jgi:hypothetical protein
MRRLSTQSERSDCVWKVDGLRSDFLGDDTGVVSYARCVKRVAVPRGCIELGDAETLDKCQCDREEKDLTLKISSQGDSEKS